MLPFTVALTLSAPAAAQQQVTVAGAELNLTGSSNGVQFTGDGTLRIPATSTFTSIGQTPAANGVSASAGGGGTPWGTIEFSRSSMTVSGRIGGETSNWLKLLKLDAANAEVTFERDVSASELQFAEAGATAVLAPKGNLSQLYQITNVTSSANNQGTLRFDNSTRAKIFLQGDIGTPSNKLKSLTFNSSTRPREVDIQGNIHAGEIALSNQSRLGLGDSVMSDPKTTYTIDAPITVSGSNTYLQIIDSNFDLKQQIGTLSGKVFSLNIFDATATFDNDINANTLQLSANSELVVNKANLAVSDQLVLQNSADGGATLTLGGNTLTAGNRVSFRNAVGTTDAQRHTLSVMVDGSGSAASAGQLDASAAGVTLTSNLQIVVSVAGGFTGAGEFAVIKSNASNPLTPSAANDDNVTCPDGFACSLALGGTDNTELRLSVTQKQIVTGDVPLSRAGEINGVEFQDDRTLTVPVAMPAKEVGQREEVTGVPVSVTTLTHDQGTVVFRGAGTVKARIGGPLTTGSGDSVTFRATPTPLIKQIEIEGANTVTFNGDVGVNRALNFAADGTAFLDGPTPPTDSALFHNIGKVTTTTTTTTAGTLRFGDRNVYFKGALGEANARLKSLSLARGASTPARAVRMLGDIHAGNIELNGRTLTLGNDASGARVFGTPDGTTYTVNAPITTNAGTGALNIKDFNVNLKGAIGADTAQLVAVTIANARAIFDRKVSATKVTLNAGANAVFNENIDAAVTLNAQSKLEVNKNLTISGALNLRGSGDPAAGATLALGANALTVSGALGFNSTHTVSLTLGGATNGQLSAANVTLPATSNLNIRVTLANNPDIWNGRLFTLFSSTAALPPELVTRARVQTLNSTDWTFAVSRSADKKRLLLTAKRVRVKAANAFPVASDRGDLALVPYYTVKDDWVTGIHIVNTSDNTQVVKVRFRRATDAMDALDFNLVMSPKDVYAGFLSGDENGVIAWSSADRTCTAPGSNNNRLEMPEIYRADAETGYVEIIAMGRPRNEQQPIAVAAKHRAVTAATGAPTVAAPTDYTPLDCDAVRSNFFADGNGTLTGTTRQGVQNYSVTWQAPRPASANATLRQGGRNTYEDSGNVLKVSYFIRDNATGVEFGDNAVHISDFLANPEISNQQYGVFSGDLDGFDFPDLNGGVPFDSRDALAMGIKRDRFNALRDKNALGVEAILNEWSVNPSNGVEMDWVVTLPGQYVMFRLPQYVAALTGAGRHWTPTVSNGAPAQSTAGACPRDANATVTPTVPACDFRDQPVQLSFTAYNREESSGEGGATPELVVSPAPPGMTVRTFLPRVANVVTFGGRSVLGRSDANVNANLGQPYGWVNARVKSRDDDVRVCDWNLAEDNARGAGAMAAGARFPSAAAGNALTLSCTELDNKGIPVIGFAAWSRNVAANPNASYGRVVEHSYRVKP